MAEIKGDLRVRRSGQFDRRANQGLLVSSTSTNYTVDMYDYHWLTIDGGAATQEIELPDAMSLTNGWKVVIHNNGTTNDLNVRESNAIPYSGTLLKAVPFVPPPAQETAAYEFVLIDNSTQAGIWYVVELGDPTISGVLASKYVANFTVGDFPGVVGGYNTLTSADIPGLGNATHGRGINPVYIVQEKFGSDYDRVICDRERMNGGDLALRVTAGAEFDGRVIFV